MFFFNNRNIRSRTKHYIYFEDGCEKGIIIDNLLNPPLSGSKLFEELVLDFDISCQDRGKFNFLIMKWIPSPWLEDPHSKDIDIFL